MRRLLKLRIMITKIMKRLAIFTMALMCLSSCQNDDNMTSYATVSTNSKGLEYKLQLYIQDEVGKFNDEHLFSVFYKDEVLEDFNNLVKTLEDEANSGKYNIFAFSSETLILKWGIKELNKVNLNLITNIPEKISLSAEIEQHNVRGDSTRFTELYSKKLTDAGFTIKENNKYAYYREFNKLADAENDLERLENDSILNYVKAYRYFNSMEEMEYQGQVDIKYELINGKDEELSPYTNDSGSSVFYEYKKEHTLNKLSAEGYVIIRKK